MNKDIPKSVKNIKDKIIFKEEGIAHVINYIYSPKQLALMQFIMTPKNLYMI